MPLNSVPKGVNPLLTCFDEQRVAYGLLNKLPGSSHNRILAGMARAGLDFVVMDAEHGNQDDASVYDSLHVIASLGVSPIVRLPGFGSESWMIKRVLDAGAHGFIVPMTETKAQAELIVSRARYVPQGIRGTGATFAHQAFRYPGNNGMPRTYSGEEYTALANKSILVICQVETKTGVENIEEICSVDGVDAIFMGPFDLAQSMGQLKQDDPALLAAIDRIFVTAKKAGKKVIGWAPGKQAIAAREKGYEAIVMTGDVLAMTRGIAEDFAAAGVAPRW